MSVRVGDEIVAGGQGDMYTKAQVDALIANVIAQTTEKPGMIKPFAGTTVPTGYLLCDGSAVSRTTYADLFAAIGTTYGSGDGSTTFNIPNAWSVFRTAIPGYSFQDVEVGQSGTEYTAPEDCWLQIWTKLKNDSYASYTGAWVVLNNCDYWAQAGATTYLSGSLHLPLRKGQTFTYNYQSNVSTVIFRYEFTKNLSTKSIIKY
ncbi:MAG: tail fiber protein [Clostridia bacterium]|nr:tail fiber protein [Clostridia bacterium]